MRNVRSLFFLLLMLLAGAGVHAQSEKPALYDPSLDARVEIGKMIAKAKTEGKHVLLQVGGNW